MTDYIDRQSAIDSVCEVCENCEYFKNEKLIQTIKDLPSAQPETKPISYLDCANAMLMMWMDEVVTDGEYNRIMDKLNAHELKKRSKNE